MRIPPSFLYPRFGQSTGSQRSVHTGKCLETLASQKRKASFSDRGKEKTWAER